MEIKTADSTIAREDLLDLINSDHKEGKIKENTLALEVLLNLIKPYCKEGNVKEITLETRFIEDLGINSARLVDIVIDIEDKFNITIEDDLADKIKTIKDALEVIATKI